MENNLLKYTQEYDLQNRLKTLKLLNANVAKCNGGKSSKSKILYEFIVQDDEVLDPIICQLSDEEDTWLYVPEECDSSKKLSEVSNSSKVSGSVWDWLGFSPRDIQLSRLYSNFYSRNATSPSSSLSLMSNASSNLSALSSSVDELIGQSSPDQGARKTAVDSRTYTRPKKRSFQTIVGKCFADNTISNDSFGDQCYSNPLTSTSNQNVAYESPISNANFENHSSASSTVNLSTPKYFSALSNNSVYTSPSSYSTCSSSSVINRSYTITNHNTSLNNCSNNMQNSSLGIIDIDELTNSQLGFNNVLDAEETEKFLNRAHQNQQQERRSLSPSTVSDKNRRTNSKYQLDETFSKSPMTNSEVLTDLTNSTNDNKLTNQTVRFRPTIGITNEKSKLFNTTANELLQISFPEGYLSPDNLAVVNDVTLQPSCNNVSSVSKNNLTVAENNSGSLTDNTVTLNVENSDNKEEIIVNNKTDSKSNRSNSGEMSINHCDGNLGLTHEATRNRVETPPQQQTEFTDPIGFSTPSAVKNGLKRKTTYDAITNKSIIQENGVSLSGRLSDSSTDTDVPSISMEDLTEEQVSPILNQTYNASSNLLTGTMQYEKSPLNQTYEVSPQMSVINTTVSRSRNALNNTVSTVLNSTFRKSPLNTTFCKSTEMLNGAVERNDSGPEDDCMSTASDSSFSSSSTHMRSVGEIQSIARLQEESLRQPTSRKKLTWTGSEGLSDTIAELRRSIPKLPTDDGSQSDHSDRSSDRYSPTTLNNNDRGDHIQPYVCYEKYPYFPGNVVCCLVQKNRNLSRKRYTSSVALGMLHHGKRKNDMNSDEDKLSNRSTSPVCLENFDQRDKKNYVPCVQTIERSTSPIRSEEIKRIILKDNVSNGKAAENTNSSASPRKVSSVGIQKSIHSHRCPKIHSPSPVPSAKALLYRQKYNNRKMSVAVTAITNSGVNGKRLPRFHGGGLKHFGGSSELYPSTGIPSTGNSIGGNYDQSRKPRLTGLRPPTMFSRPVTQLNSTVIPGAVTREPAADSCSGTGSLSTAGGAGATQVPSARPSGIRPPSVIPRPMSRLPAPKVRSGLPKYSSVRGRNY